MENQENNKLIAEFMGYQECHMKLYRMDDKFQFVTILSEYQDGDNECLTIEAGTRTINFNPKDMKFDESWDWLMPVLAKIDALDYENNEDQNFVGDITCALVNIDIVGTYSAVVRLIEDYNLNK